MQEHLSQRKIFSHDFAVPLLLALFQFILHIVFHGSYGYFRDELYYIACSRHLAWGYVDQPPFSIALLAVVRATLGDSLHAIRFLPALASSCVVVLAALTARKLGGGRFAQGFAALAVVLAPGLLSDGRYFSMNSFDVLFWVTASYIVVTILADEKPKLWLLFGIVVGLGLLNKYSISFFCIGLFGGLLLTSHRKQLFTRWFWLGALAAFIIFLPHIVWEIQNDLPSVEFMRNASAIKNVMLSPLEFFRGQIRDMNHLNAPVWLAGLFFFLFTNEGKRFRTLGWMYLIVFAVMVATNAKVYYLAPIYPMLLAGGSVFVEKLLGTPSRSWIKPVYVCLLIMMGMIAAPFAIPVLPVETFIRYEALLGVTPHADEHNPIGKLPQYYADEFGWEGTVAKVAKAYGMLTKDEQSQCVIYARNYGEAGAIDFFGKEYGLPNAICAHNNYWLWGPGEKSGDVAIIFGSASSVEESLADLKHYYKSVELVATTDCGYCMPFENNRPIFICKGANFTLQKIWSGERFYI